MEGLCFAASYLGLLSAPPCLLTGMEKTPSFRRVAVDRDLGFRFALTQPARIWGSSSTQLPQPARGRVQKNPNSNLRNREIGFG